ncbi:MAG: pyridoxamine 5'-phosphate oxidase family protein [Gammaproteobacteria bacterium]|nr:pyridoxamine 5'-phosphate oxidase family protein [Gammaproteobacteria bacterium]
MAEFYTELNDTLKKVIAKQKIFFIATAPTEGRISLSPKGLDSLHCLDDKTIAFLNLTGSGNETAAHLFQNGRMTMMFCSFTENPLIIRIYGQGRVIHPRDKAWAELYPLFKPLPGPRQIIILDIDSAQTSCGYGVPIYEFKEERALLHHIAEKAGEEGLEEYKRKNNQVSIDGLPTRILEN